MAGGFVLVRHEDDRTKYELIPRYSIISYIGKLKADTSITYRSEHGQAYSRVVVCTGTKSSCMAFLTNLGGGEHIDMKNTILRYYRIINKTINDDMSVLCDETDLLNEMEEVRAKRQRQRSEKCVDSDDRWASFSSLSSSSS